MGYLLTMDYCRIADDVVLGEGVTIHSFVNLYGCRIGACTNIGTFVEVQKNAQVGENCKISSHSFICEGVTIGDNVFIGHNVTFINDRYPKAVNQDGSKQTDENWQVVPTDIKEGASIGSSVTILCGVTIGKGAVVGAGSLVLADVPDCEVWAGNPAKFIKKVVV